MVSPYFSHESIWPELGNRGIAASLLPTPPPVNEVDRMQPRRWLRRRKQRRIRAFYGVAATSFSFGGILVKFADARKQAYHGDGKLDTVTANEGRGDVSVRICHAARSISVTRLPLDASAAATRKRGDSPHFSVVTTPPHTPSQFAKN
jgi:hypothetical protein